MSDSKGQERRQRDSLCVIYCAFRFRSPRPGFTGLLLHEWWRPIEGSDRKGWECILRLNLLIIIHSLLLQFSFLPPFFVLESNP